MMIDSRDSQQILNLQNETERVSKFATENPKRKASTLYIRVLTSPTLSIIEQLVGRAFLTFLDD